MDESQEREHAMEQSDFLTARLEGVTMWDENDDVEELISGSSKQSNNPSTFDLAIGALEEIVMRPSFQSLYNAFLDSNYTKFSKVVDKEINPEQFDIFKHYSNTIGNYLETKLKKRVENFDMEEFVTELSKRPELMENEIIEMVFSLMDYTKFNELILDYSASKEDNGRLGKLMEAGITVHQIGKSM